VSRPAPRLARALLVLLLAPALARGATEVASEWVGRPLTEALEALRDQGLRLLYGSNVVRSSMLVTAEPEGASPREILDEILAPHGLAAEEAAGGILRIVTSPEGALAGEVRVALGGTPVAGAVVEVLGHSSTKSDDAGRFLIEGLPAGAHQLEIRKAGFVIERLAVRVPAGETGEVEVRLHAVAETLEEIVVTPGQVTLLSDAPAAGTHWTRAEIGRLPHLSDDLFRAISRLSGAATGDFSADFHVRGGERSEVLVLFDGLRVYEPYHVRDIQNVFSIFDTRVTGAVETMSGGFTAEYGDSMSGVIEISSLVPTERQTLLSLTFEKVHFATQGTLPAVGGDWLVSGRRGYLDLLLDFAKRGDDFDLRPSYWDVFAKIRRQLGRHHLITFSVLSAGDHLIFEDDGEDDLLKSSYGNSYAWAKLDSMLGTRLSQSTVLAIGWLDSERVGHSGANLSDPFPVPKTEDDLTRVVDRRDTRLSQLRQDWRYNASDRHALRWGTEAQHLEASYDYDLENRITDPVFTESPILTQRHLDLSPSGWTYGLYLADRFRLTSRLTLEGGVRWDRQTYAADQQTSPRLNLAQQMGSQTVVRASWGRYAQSEGIHELQIADGVQQFHRAQVNEQTTLAVEHRISSRSRLSAQVYDKRIPDPRPRFENLFELVDIFPEGQSDRVLVAAERARSRGLEALFEHRRRRFEGWAAYTLSRAEDRLDGAWVPRSWDQRHALSYSLNWRIEDRWNVNVAGLHHTGWPATDVRLATDEAGNVSLEPTARNSSRYPDYHRVDLRASRAFALSSGTLELFLEITNLFDRDNLRSSSDFEITYENGFVAIQREHETWLPRLPSFGVTWVF
jgi:outer membrane cobalamin receptor